VPIDLELLPFAFAAGLATFFSPCAGALLPAYVSLYLSRVEQGSLSWWKRGLQGLTLGGVISVGFLTSIGALGLLFALIGSAVGGYIPWLGVGVGLLMVLTGIWILVRPWALGTVEGRISRWLYSLMPSRMAHNPAHAPEGPGLLSFYVYGLFYAVCAAACTLPIFLAVMTQTLLSSGLLGGLLSFFAYGWGMSVMMLLFAVALAYSKAAVTKLFGSLSRWVPRVGGAFMIAAGGYVLYYLLIYGRYLDDLLGR
jgi:cytochrome c-type biogenesis protein